MSETSQVQSSAAVKRGRFIVLEGIDGSGTTTQARLLHEALTKRGQAVVQTCEPTPGPIGTLIRQALSKRFVVPAPGGSRAPDWKTMALLFAADRIDHNDALIIPALERGESVISDRYYLSSLAYQSLTSPSPEEVLPWLRQLNSRALEPDLTLVCDVDARVAAQRRSQRSGQEELFEVDALQAQLAQAYANAEQLLPGERVVHVDAAQSTQQVAALILRAVDELWS